MPAVTTPGVTTPSVTTPSVTVPTVPPVTVPSSACPPTTAVGTTVVSVPCTTSAMTRRPRESRELCTRLAPTWTRRRHSRVDQGSVSPGGLAPCPQPCDSFATADPTTAEEVRRSDLGRSRGTAPSYDANWRSLDDHWDRIAMAELGPCPVICHPTADLGPVRFTIDAVSAGSDRVLRTGREGWSQREAPASGWRLDSDRSTN